MEIQQRSSELMTNTLKKRRRPLTTGLLSLVAFAVGFWVDPVYLRMMWILASGTLTIVSGIWIYLMVNKLLS